MNKIELTNKQNKALDQVLHKVDKPVIQKTLLEYFKSGKFPDNISDEILFASIHLIQEISGVAFISLKHITNKHSTSGFNGMHEILGDIPMFRQGAKPVAYITCDKPILETIVSVSTIGTPPGQVYLRKGPLALVGLNGFSGKTEIVSTEFIYLYLKLHESYFGKKSSGTILRTIKGSFIDNFKIPVLPKHKQQEIVDLLMPMLQTQEELKLTSEKTELQKKVLLDLVFKRLDSQSASSSEGVELFNKLSAVPELKALCAVLNIDVSELSDAEHAMLLKALIDYRDNQDLSTFEAIAKQTAQITPEQKAKKQSGAEVEHVFKTFCNIYQAIFGYIRLPLKLAGRVISMKAVPKDKTEAGTEVAHWQSGTKPTEFISFDYPHQGPAVIIARSGYAGTVSYWDGPKLTHSNVSIEPRSGVSKGFFLYCTTKAAEPSMRSKSTGTGVNHVAPSTIKNTYVVVPNLETQDRITKDLTPLEQYSTLIDQQAERIQKLFGYYLRSSFAPYTATARELTSSANL